jgi:hypothetical protein
MTDSIRAFIKGCSAGDIKYVQSRLKGGLAPETRDEHGLTGLIWAARKGQIEVADVLLKNGADIEANDGTGRTALFHAVAFKRHEFVEHLAAKGANINPIDMHGWTPLDLASSIRSTKMVELLKRLGARRAYSEEPPADGVNVFSLGSQIGGPDAAMAIVQKEQELRDAMNRWTGRYCSAIREFAFILRVDGQFHAYTEKWSIRGAQKAKRKKDWIEVEVGIPESWWRENHGRNYKRYLIREIENGLRSMIELLKRNRHEINSEALLADWEKIKRDHMSDSESASIH